MHRMKIKIQKLSRPSYAVLALALALAGLAPVINTQKAHAFPGGGQLQSRAIRMSSSAPSTTSLGTNLSYLVSFNPATNHTITGIVLHFCNSASTPIIGDATCTAPAGFSVSSATVQGTPPNNPVAFTALGGTWTPTAPSANLLKITSAGVAVTTGTTYSFQVNVVTNPNTTGTFYARMVTYTGATTAGSEYANYAAGTEGSTSATDYGGFALSTANVITITAKVQETMTFCVSGQAPGPGCGATGLPVNTPALALGHGANTILDNTVVDTASAFTQLSTNAQGGAAIRMRNTATSGGLNSGTNSIPASNAGATTPAAIATNAAGFGLYVAAGTGGTGTIAADGNYNDGTTTHYGMDTTAITGVTGTFGDIIASATAPVNSVGNQLTFGAQASNTTPAGLYTANIILIATGTF
jgi:hypothetical protein